ncbi:MAG: two-component system, NtrC family, sensor histidine kinase GlrK [Pseudomonadota bacterium]|nr:two-component system, NtrC family, sensor histidine kinase GlrK [Pseudomonadota bacterium]
MLRSFLLPDAMRRLSFRTTLLIGFLLLATFLGAAALRGLLALEDFSVKSRKSADLAVQVTADLQQLAERTVDLERSARQYLVLKDPALKLRFDILVAEALPALERLQAIDASSFSPPANDWRNAVLAAQDQLPEKDAEATLAAMSRLGDLNEVLAGAGHAWIERQNSALLGELEHNRVGLFVQVLASMAGALFLAIAMAWWLIRPIGRLEAAIEQLGESRFEQPIEIHGPVDLQRLGHRLDWLRRRLSDLEADRARILRHVSHELKTPLAALREGVALLQEEVVGPLAVEQREVASILEHNARALQRQIEDLLNYHATVFDAAHLQRRRIALRTLLEAAAEEQRLQLQARDLRVEIDCGRQHAQIDPDKIRVALGNLLSNAISFSPAGGVIRLVAGVRGDTVFIDCIDQGAGVAAADAEKIFDPFVQGSRRPLANQQGSGVGLSIVRELVSAQGGRVFLVESENRADFSGAHFRMELPNEP